MSFVGYARARADDPCCLRQVSRLQHVGCNRVKLDLGGAPGQTKILDTLVEGLGQGDALVVTDLDSLGLRPDRLLDFVRGLGSRGVFLVADRPAIDTALPAGKAFFGMLDIFAEFRPLDPDRTSTA